MVRPAGRPARGTEMRCGFLFVLLLSHVAAGSAHAQISECWPPWELSTVELATDVTGPVSVMVVPDGSGDALGEARAADGSPVDATITATLIDCGGLPIAGFPGEDLWLEAADGGLVACIGGTAVAGNTDAEGRTRFQAPLRAGGHSEAACIVMVSGTPLTYPPYLPLHFNSPDENGDRMVNLSDVATFAGDFFGSYSYRSDFHFDGVINLIDVVRMAGAMGADCP